MGLSIERAETRLKETTAQIAGINGEIGYRTARINSHLENQLTADKLRDALPTLCEAKAAKIIEMTAAVAALEEADPQKAVQMQALLNLSGEFMPEEVQLKRLDDGHEADVKKIKEIEAEIVELISKRTSLAQRESDQKAALARKQAAYPAALKAHLRRCACGGFEDQLKRKKAVVA